MEHWATGYRLEVEIEARRISALGEVAEARERVTGYECGEPVGLERRMVGKVR